MIDDCLCNSFQEDTICTFDKEAKGRKEELIDNKFVEWCLSFIVAKRALSMFPFCVLGKYVATWLATPSGANQTSRLCFCISVRCLPLVFLICLEAGGMAACHSICLLSACSYC